MKTITIQAIRDIATGCYMTYEHGWNTVQLPDDSYPTPESIVGTKTDPDIFRCDHIAADPHIVRDWEIAERIIADGVCTQKEWDAISDEMRADEIEEYGIQIEMGGQEICEHGIEYLELTFSIDSLGVVRKVRSKKVAQKASNASYRAVMGERLKAFREECGLSAYKVAQKGGIQMAQVAAVESGSTNYTIDSFLGYIRGCNMYMYFATKGMGGMEEMIQKGRDNCPG